MSSIHGLGVSPWHFAFCINNVIPIDDYSSFAGVRALAPGEINYIVKRCSNHWRKLFNVYAKCLFEMGWGEQASHKADTWQEYRDLHLLQQHSNEALLFSAPTSQPQGVRVIAGKTYGLGLTWPRQPDNLGEGFYAWPELKTFISPYLDYRQLSNQRITKLVKLINQYW